MKWNAALVALGIFVFILGMVWTMLNGPLIAALMFFALAMSGIYILSGIL